MARKPKPLTRESLREAALTYVGRRETTRTNLRRVLFRRLHRHAQRSGVVPAEAEDWIEAIVDELVAKRFVDDQRYARLRAESLIRSGHSRRSIESKLAAKGLGRDDIGEVLAALVEAAPEAEWEAIVRYAKRRRLGPHAPDPIDAETRRKHKAKLYRAGFGRDLVSRLFEGDP